MKFAFHNVYVYVCFSSCPIKQAPDVISICLSVCWYKAPRAYVIHPTFVWSSYFFPVYYYYVGSVMPCHAMSRHVTRAILSGLALVLVLLRAGGS